MSVGAKMVAVRMDLRNSRSSKTPKEHGHPSIASRSPSVMTILSRQPRAYKTRNMRPSSMHEIRDRQPSGRDFVLSNSKQKRTLRNGS